MKIININDVPWQTTEKDHFAYARKSLGQAAGSQMLGASLFKLAAGKKAFPFHGHYGNEEAFLILEGQGLLRLGIEEFVLKKGDFVAIPKGPEHPHQIINNSDHDLVYFAFSTMIHPDVAYYPDSDKIGILVGSAPGGIKNEISKSAYFENANKVDYLKGE